MSEMWQEWTIGISVIGAAAYLIYRFIRWRHRQNACGDCALRKVALGREDESTKRRPAD